MSWEANLFSGAKRESGDGSRRTAQLEILVEELKAQLNQTNLLHDSPLSTDSMQKQNPTKPLYNSKLSTDSVKVGLFKPRDIPVLELHQLQGLDATARLQMFFELIEQCSSSDATRIQIAKGRVCPEFSILIHNYQANLKVETWSALKNLFVTEFTTEVSVDRAWQELEAMSYDWGESPQAFTHRFICQHAVIATKLPNEKFPDRDKTIKRKLWYGLPIASREKLEGFLDEGYPLKKFLDRIEHERQILEDRPTQRINMIPTPKGEGKGNGRGGDKHTRSSQPETIQDEVEGLKQQIQELKVSLAQAKLEKSPSHASSSRRETFTQKYCAYCQSPTHNLPECWRKPPPGHCFDCRKPGCRRGDRNCPGRAQASSLQQQSQTQNPRQLS
ncbi:hypothetical protein GWK47_017372 [Chionoecetes opilio]|uniref:Uncharacterized protein n=1 Tax=Chionoecetes opilio TaxID=41210 RepID=A0A8J4XW05_CHIOP|nr:hypothetical protein GWK47_017372 [Chionoecetes opilio]